MSAAYSKNIHNGSAQAAQRLCTARPVAVHSQGLCMAAVQRQPSGCVYCKNISLIYTALLCI